MVLCERNHSIARNHTFFPICLNATRTDKESWNQEELAKPKRYCVLQAIYKTEYLYANKINQPFWLTV